MQANETPGVDALSSSGNPLDYEAVLFDMDGVLLEGRRTPPEIYERATMDALSVLGVDPTTDQLETLQASRYRPTMRTCCADLGVDVETFWDTRERCASARSHRRLRSGFRSTYSDTESLLGLNVPLAIVSNNRQATVDFVREFFF